MPAQEMQLVPASTGEGKNLPPFHEPLQEVWQGWKLRVRPALCLFRG